MTSDEAREQYIVRRTRDVIRNARSDNFEKNIAFLQMLGLCSSAFDDPEKGFFRITALSLSFDAHDVQDELEKISSEEYTGDHHCRFCGMPSCL